MPVERDSGAALADSIEQHLQAMSTRTTMWCAEALDRSAFFSLLRERALPPSLMQYAFLQYRFWRDQLHRWFALCILKCGTCDEPDQKNAIMAMANHIYTDLRDGHEVMYVDYLHDLQLSDAQIAASRPSLATLAYARSFLDDFGYGTENFHEAMATLSGRELCVAVRNGRILRDYIRPRNLPESAWLVLHEALEEEHYRDAIRPVVMRHGRDADELERLMQSVRRGIERHVQFFDELLLEHLEHRREPEAGSDPSSVP